MLEKTSRPRIIFFGTPDFAVASLKALTEHQMEVIAVVTAPDKPAGRGMQVQAPAVKTYAADRGIPVLQPEKLKDPRFLEQLRSLQADLQVIVAFRMLPEAVWSMPPMGTINVHASLLPQYRGAAPINWAIINGEKETGLTTFKLQHEIDTGDILLQQPVAISPDDDAGTLYEKMKEAGAQLLLTTIEGLQAGSIVPRPQPFNDHCKPAPKIFREHCRINWNQPAAAVHNLIRGLAPYPAAYTIFKEKQLKIFRSRVDDAPAPRPAAGDYETDGKTFLRFAASDGWVYVLEVQYEGKKRMMIADFLRGFRL